MKSVSRIMILYIMCLISCEKSDSANKVERSSVVSSNLFLPAPNTTGQQDAITRMKIDPDVKAYASKALEVFGKAYSIKDTALRNALIKAQLGPYLEKMHTKWSAFLKGRPDKNEIIRAGIGAAFPRMPLPASTMGPCEDTQNQDIGKCHRTLAVEAGLCALSWVAGPVAFGGCLVIAGAKSFLCVAEADIAYKRCLASIRTNLVRDVYRIDNWIWYRTKGWMYDPRLQLTIP
jgi:hypothetical protein